eukprot:4157265-Amphidinium_carterae.1
MLLSVGPPAKQSRGCFDALRHRDCEHMLGEACRVLREGGRFLCLSNNEVLESSRRHTSTSAHKRSNSRGHQNANDIKMKCLVTKSLIELRIKRNSGSANGCYTYTTMSSSIS